MPILSVVGVDPGTNCGYAVLTATAGTWVTSGVWDLKPNRHEGGGMRWVRLETYLNKILEGCPSQNTALAYEEVRRHAGTDAAHIYGGVIATIQRVCEFRLIPYTAIPVGTVKRLATNKGNASKDAMLRQAQLRWGDRIAAEDEADALWIAEALRLQLRG